MGAGSVPVDVLFLACPGTKGADAVLGVGGTGIFSTGAVHRRWGWRLRKEEQSDLSLKRDRIRSQEQPSPRQLLLPACLTREFPQAGQVINTCSLVPHMVHRKDCMAGDSPSPQPHLSRGLT